ncbi:MAG TPA: sodium:solute symporter [Gemmatimonadaceae bacterium]|nr:sodium:solute symporter [Gemmatimonadaceae bacterium]
MNTHFTALDFLVLVAYLIATTLLGIWLGRNQKDTKDYFVAGHAIPWWAVLFSVVATETSALTFISIPGLAYTTNLGFLQIAAGYLLGRIVVAYTLLPRYYQGDLVTAYALLEKRFGVGTRRFASIVFMVTRAFADSVRVFATAIPIALIIGPAVPQRFVMPVAILTLGALTLLYTYHGGMRAVVWTDVLQTSVYLLGGFSALYLLGKGVDGGWSAILSQARDAGKLKMIDVYWGFDKPYTLFAGLIGGAFLSMASHGADQLIVQRLLAASSLKQSRKALIGSGIAVWFQFALFMMIGIGLYAFYQARPFAQPDSIFPSFVVDSMPAGLRGLIVAAVLAATMSAHSGAMNSLAAATTHDIYLPISGRSVDDPRTLRISKLFTLFWGVVLLAAALLYREQGTPVVVIALSIASFTYGALLGGFFLGMLWSRANQRDAITGMAVGIIAMSFVVFAKQMINIFPSMTGLLTTLSHISFPWFVLIGTTFTVGVGILSSFTHQQPTGRAQRDVAA